MRKIIVAIDGFSSSGKSTLAKELAAYAGYTYIDTGAMYRAISLFGIRKGWITEDAINIDEFEKYIRDIRIEFRKNAEGRNITYLNGENVETEIRTLEVSNGASRISTLGFVRKEMVRQQQEMGKQKAIVMDGRDIGTVVFPDAELKFYVTAKPEVRAERRFQELKNKGIDVAFADVLENILERDQRDQHREESPLRQAEDAILIDNSYMNRDEQRQLLRDLFDKKVKEKK